ncbi:glutamate ABC transporter substrate-binding protein [Actinomadura harenae]|uniref:Glutamate ABC transporter substrate-binding protein n=1 Tax=Actinomadura harenae TaxID=2483351 RepID=A0A3M2LMG7_9ACTN|nr:glutamate ABC transporter substrate-binding protein [Actinomadura harenae]RMI38316.1 glutamate ABC transporter substrate-binding protein [Actinomadura harenae]
MVRTSVRMRWAAPVAVAALSLVGLTACSSSDDSGSSVPGAAGGGKQDDLVAAAPVAANLPAGSTMEKIKKRGQLVIGGSLDAPLLSQQNPANKKVEGLDADFGRLLAKYIIGKPDVKIVNSASETREALLSNGTVDVVFQTYSITPERAKQVAFAGPYYSSGLVVATKKDTTGITSASDLKGKTVIAGANTPAIAAIKKVAPDAKIVTFGTDPECVQALKQGRGDAYVQDEALLLATAKQDPSIKIQGKPFTSDPYGIGLKHGDAQMKQFVNDWLKQIQASGLWAKVWKNSIGTVVEGDAPQAPALGSAPGSE